MQPLDRGVCHLTEEEHAVFCKYFCAVALDIQAVQRCKISPTAPQIGLTSGEAQVLSLLAGRLCRRKDGLRIIGHAVAHRTELLGGKGIAAGGSRAGRQRIDRLCHGLDALLDAGHVLGVDLGLFFDP